MADQQKPQKNDNTSSGGGSKRNNRRYFRRRRKGPGSSADGLQNQEKGQGKSPSDAQSQSGKLPEQRSEQQERRRKRRRSNNSGGSGTSNRRSSSSRRQRRQEQSNPTPATVAPEPERYQEPVDVFVHTHIVRPAYRDAGSDYVSETSFLSSRRPPETSIHMDRLQEEINRHLDEYFSRTPVQVKVTREAGDEDWDDETSEDEE